MITLRYWQAHKVKKGQQKQPNETNKGKSISHTESHFKNNLYACIQYPSVFSYTKALKSAMLVHSILLGNTQHQGQAFFFPPLLFFSFLESVMAKTAAWKKTIPCVHWLAMPMITAGPRFLSSNLPQVKCLRAAPTCIPFMTCWRTRHLRRYKKPDVMEDYNSLQDQAPENILKSLYKNVLTGIFLLLFWSFLKKKSSFC